MGENSATPGAASRMRRRACAPRGAGGEREVAAKPEEKSSVEEENVACEANGAARRFIVEGSSGSGGREIRSHRSGRLCSGVLNHEQWAVNLVELGLASTNP